MKERITDIFFDLDHTLWDFDKNSEKAFDKIFQEQHRDIVVKDFVKIYAPINQALWKLFQVDKITHDQLRYSRLRETFDMMDYSISDDEINRISYDYIEFLPENNLLFEGAIEVLDYLAPNYNLHIITNGLGSVQMKKLKNSGLEGYFKTVTNSEMAGVKKPHSAIFSYALSLAGAKKENTLMIGDCIEADIKGAMDFGMEAVWFDEKKTDVYKGVLTINHLLDLKNIL